MHCIKYCGHFRLEITSVPEAIDVAYWQDLALWHGLAYSLSNPAFLDKLCENKMHDMLWIFAKKMDDGGDDNAWCP